MDSTSGVKSGGYTVTKVADQCTKGCSGPMCSKAECNQLCIHMYTCDQACYDFNNGVDQARQSHLSSTTREHMSNKDPSSEQFLLNEGDDFDSLEYAAELLIPYYQQGIMYTTLMIIILIIHIHP